MGTGKSTFAGLNTSLYVKGRLGAYKYIMLGLLTFLRQHHYEVASIVGTYSNKIL